VKASRIRETHGSKSGDASEAKLRTKSPNSRLSPLQIPVPQLALFDLFTRLELEHLHEGSLMIENIGPVATSTILSLVYAHIFFFFRDISGSWVASLKTPDDKSLDKRKKSKSRCEKKEVRYAEICNSPENDDRKTFSQR
jgi:hypothetical protein